MNRIGTEDPHFPDTVEPLAKLAAERSDSTATSRTARQTLRRNLQVGTPARQRRIAFMPRLDLPSRSENHPALPGHVRLSRRRPEEQTTQIFAVTSSNHQRFEPGDFTSNNDCVRTIAHSSGNVWNHWIDRSFIRAVTTTWLIGAGARRLEDGNEW
jgi:hypothetical protein